MNDGLIVAIIIGVMVLAIAGIVGVIVLSRRRRLREQEGKTPEQLYKQLKSALRGWGIFLIVVNVGALLFGISAASLAGQPNQPNLSATVGSSISILIFAVLFLTVDDALLFFAYAVFLILISIMEIISSPVGIFLGVLRILWALYFFRTYRRYEQIETDYAAAYDQTLAQHREEMEIGRKLRQVAVPAGFIGGTGETTLFVIGLVFGITARGSSLPQWFPIADQLLLFLVILAISLSAAILMGRLDQGGLSLVSGGVAAIVLLAVIVLNLISGPLTSLIRQAAELSVHRQATLTPTIRHTAYPPHATTTPVYTPTQSVLNDAVVMLAPEGASDLTPDGTYLHDFGHSIALDGHTIMVTAPAMRADTPGLVYLYQRAGGSWHQAEVIRGPEGVPSFGRSAVLDGDTAVIGAANRVFMYEKSGGTWTLRGDFAPDSDDQMGAGKGPSFGDILDIHNGWVVVGSPRSVGPDEGNLTRKGAAYLYHRESDGSWTELPRFTVPMETGKDLGFAVDLDGDYLAIASHGVKSITNNGGTTIFTFRLSDNAWEPLYDLITFESVASMELHGNNLGLLFSVYQTRARFQIYNMGELFSGQGGNTFDIQVDGYQQVGTDIDFNRDFLIVNMPSFDHRTGKPTLFVHHPSYDGYQWSLAQTLLSPKQVPNILWGYGETIALNGTTLVVSASGRDYRDQIYQQGYALVYDLSDQIAATPTPTATFLPTETLTPTATSLPSLPVLAQQPFVINSPVFDDPAQAMSSWEFGTSVAAHEGTIVVGAAIPISKGFVYRRTGNVWELSSTLLPPEHTTDFGNQVTLIGNEAVLSSPKRLLVYDISSDNPLPASYAVDPPFDRTRDDYVGWIVGNDNWIISGFGPVFQRDASGWIYHQWLEINSPYKMVLNNEMLAVLHANQYNFSVGEDIVSLYTVQDGSWQPLTDIEHNDTFDTIALDGKTLVIARQEYQHIGQLRFYRDLNSKEPIILNMPSNMVDGIRGLAINEKYLVVGYNRLDTRTVRLLIYRRNDALEAGWEEWRQVDDPIEQDEYSYFGRSITLDGDLLIVSASTRDPNPSGRAGSIYVFDLSQEP